MMTWWTHLFPSRTQKLSTMVAMVSYERAASCRALFFYYLFIVLIHFFILFKLVINFLVSIAIHNLT